MKVATTVCGNCGDKILGDSPKGLCPACVLETGLGPLADERVTGIDSSAVAACSAEAAAKAESAKADDAGHPAEVLMDFGDYELLEEIGRGGQGVVYRARQKSLNRMVALKVIGLGQWATQAHLKRFRREAEAAANLDHPCIVPIYDVGEREGSCYFSMKLIDGGQLDEVAKRTPISIRNAAELIAKLARTVHYAHEHGILHRDIKPGNILVDSKGEPHLTDFGLARLLETKSTVTHTMDVLGTPSYMAPEQASGRNEQLTSATDVYGLGAVFYQLLTGHPPFAGGTTYETVRLVLETEPRQPRLWNPKIDRELSTICLKCLEKDPKRRYSSAFALAEDLEHWLKHEPIRARHTGIFARGRKWLQRNPTTVLLFALSLAFAATLAIIVWKSLSVRTLATAGSALNPTAPEKSVAVLPFENLSRDPDNAYFAEGIQEEILTRLASIADLKVISRTSTQQYQSKPRNLSQIAKQLGVANVLEGSVQKVADQVRVNVQLVNAQTDSHLWAETYDRKLTDIFSVESEIAKGIAESLRAKLTGREEQALAVKPTNNLDAYDAYLRGLVFRTRVSSSSTDPARKAIGFFEQAVQLDPNFALAWAGLSRADAAFYFAGGDPTAARRDAAKRALENAQKLQPNSPETLLALGYYQYWVMRDYALAKTTFELVRKMLPGSSEIPFALASVARREGKWDESVAHWEEGLALDPRNPQLLNETATTYAVLRQFPRALKLYDRTLDILPNDLVVTARKAAIYQAQGDLQEAAKLLAEVNAQTPSGTAFETKITQLILERNLDEAVRLLQARQAQFDFASEYDKGGLDDVMLAFAQRLTGDTAGAKVTAEQARNTFEPLCQQQPDNDGFAAWLSLSYALLGNKDSALKQAERAMVLLPSTKDRIDGPRYEEFRALIWTMFGENSRAISTLTHLLQTPYDSLLYGPPPITPALLRLDPLWDPLRADPAFQKLCEEKIEKSVAVLPFANLGRDPDNAYFAEGIQDEILTRLASIADLKVISRTSTQQYQNKPRNLGEIANQLGVANVLEGSVQKVADQVRVNVQLVNAQTDSHLWADTYDRKLTDILGVEGEIAEGIAKSLQAKLTGGEKQALAVKPTNNPEAYDAYLRGLAFEAHSRNSVNGRRKAIDAYERAVQLDPKFAFAWARLSRAHAYLYFYPFDSTADRRDATKKALKNAQKLQPNSPETLLALGYYQYWVLRDYQIAKTTFKQVSRTLPGSSEVLSALGIVARREGNWDESVGSVEEGLSLDPRNADLLGTAAEIYAAMRQFPTALKLYDRALDVVSNDPDRIALKAGVYQAQGKLQEAARLLMEANEQTTFDPVLEAKFAQLRLERNYSEAIRLLQARLAQFHFGSEMEKGYAQLMLALTQRLSGDTAAATAAAEQARKTLEPLCSNQPENSRFASLLALSYAALGNKDSALKEAERAIMLLPSAKDRWAGPALEEILALIQTTFDEHSRAISTLARLLQTPYISGIPICGPTPVTAAVLRLDPFWDPLRSDPAFQKLCEEKQP